MLSIQYMQLERPEISERSESSDDGTKSSDGSTPPPNNVIIAIKLTAPVAPIISVPIDFVVIVDVADVTKVTRPLHRLVALMRQRNCGDCMSIVTFNEAMIMTADYTELTADYAELTESINDMRGGHHGDFAAMMHTAKNVLIRRTNASHFFLFTDNTHDHSHKLNCAMARYIFNNLTVFDFVGDANKHLACHGQHVNISDPNTLVDKVNQAYHAVTNITMADIYMYIPDLYTTKMYGCNRLSFNDNVLFIPSMRQNETRTVIALLRLPANVDDYQYNVSVITKYSVFAGKATIGRQTDKIAADTVNFIKHEHAYHAYLYALKIMVEDKAMSLPLIDSALAMLKNIPDLESQYVHLLRIREFV